MKKLLRAGWLVMAAALMAGLAACTSDESGSEVVEPQAVTPNAVSTIHVTVGAGIGGDSEAQTRSNVSKDGSSRKLKFTEGDRLFVSAVVTANWDYIVAGTLSIVNNTITSDGSGASFSGDLKVYHNESGTMVPSAYSFTEADPLDECRNFQAGLIAKDMSDDCYIIDKYYNFGLNYTMSIAVDDPEDDSDDCVSTLMKKALKVMGTSYDTQYYGVEGPKMFRSFEGDPILNCEISGLTIGTEYTVTVLGDYDENDYNSNAGYAYNVTFASTVTATSDGKARFAISLESGEASVGSYWTLKLVGGGETRYVKLGQKEMVKITNKVYRVNREAQLDIVDLSSVTTSSDGVETVNDVPTLRLRDGQGVTGSLVRTDDTKKVMVTIADGATVTLSGVTIDGKATSGHSTPWAGITCEGDANIILSGANTVTNFDSWYPAIFVPSGKTITVGGTGSLTASNTYNEGTGTGAAIGGGPGANCGSITINGGTVTATATDGAGIGSGSNNDKYVTCGDITISGTASVTATGGINGAGIGSGGASRDNGNVCGDITISGTCTVNAQGGINGAGIGTGYMASCGSVTINGGTVTATGGSNAAGIGCGKGEDDRKSVCSAITIKTIEGYEADFTSVTAITGDGAFRPIGHSSDFTQGDFSTCGTITFGIKENRTVYTEGENPGSYNTGDGEHLHFSESEDKNTWVLTGY